MVLNIIPMIQIGNKRKTAFSSSIWVTKQSLHGFTDLFAWSDDSYVVKETKTKTKIKQSNSQLQD